MSHNTSTCAGAVRALTSRDASNDVKTELIRNLLQPATVRDPPVLHAEQVVLGHVYHRLGNVQENAALTPEVESFYWDTVRRLLGSTGPSAGQTMPRAVLSALVRAISKEGVRHTAFEVVIELLASQVRQRRMPIRHFDLEVLFDLLVAVLRGDAGALDLAAGSLERRVASAIVEACRKERVAYGSGKRAFQLFLSRALTPAVQLLKRALEEQIAQDLVQETELLCRDFLFVNIQLSDVLIENSYLQSLFESVASADDSVPLSVMVDLVCRQFLRVLHERPSQDPDGAPARKKRRLSTSEAGSAGFSSSSHDLLALTFFRELIGALLRRLEPSGQTPLTPSKTDGPRQYTGRQSTYEATVRLLVLASENGMYVPAYDLLDKGSTRKRLEQVFLICTRNLADRYAVDLLRTALDEFFEVVEESIDVIFKPVMEILETHPGNEAALVSVLKSIVSALGKRRQLLLFFDLMLARDSSRSWLATSTEVQTAVEEQLTRSPDAQVYACEEVATENRTNQEVACILLCCVFRSLGGRLISRGSAEAFFKRASNVAQTWIAPEGPGKRIARSSVALAVALASSMLDAAKWTRRKQHVREAYVTALNGKRLHDALHIADAELVGALYRVRARACMARQPSQSKFMRKDMLLRHGTRYLLDAAAGAYASAPNQLGGLLREALELLWLHKISRRWGSVQEENQSPAMRAMAVDVVAAVCCASSTGQQSGVDAILADERFYELTGSEDLLATALLDLLESSDSNAGLDVPRRLILVPRMKEELQKEGVARVLELMAHLPLASSTNAFGSCVRCAYHLDLIRAPNDRAMQAACLKFLRVASEASPELVLRLMTPEFADELAARAPPGSEDALRDERDAIIVKITSHILKTGVDDSAGVLGKVLAAAVHNSSVAAPVLAAFGDVPHPLKSAHVHAAVPVFQAAVSSLVSGSSDDGREVTAHSGSTVQLATALLASWPAFEGEPSATDFGKRLLSWALHVAGSFVSATPSSALDTSGSRQVLRSLCTSRDLLTISGHEKLAALFIVAARRASGESMSVTQEAFRQYIRRGSTRQVLRSLTQTVLADLVSVEQRSRCGAMHLSVTLLETASRGLGGGQRRYVRQVGATLLTSTMKCARETTGAAFSIAMVDVLQAARLVAEKEDLFTFDSQHMTDILSTLNGIGQPPNSGEQIAATKLVGALLQHRTALCRPLLPLFSAQLCWFLSSDSVADEKYVLEVAGALQRFAAAATESSLKRYAGPILLQVVSARALMSSSSRTRKTLVRAVVPLIDSCTERDLKRMHLSLDAARKRAFQELYEEYNSGLKYRGKV